MDKFVPNIIIRFKFSKFTQNKQTYISLRFDNQTENRFFPRRYKKEKNCWQLTNIQYQLQHKKRNKAKLVEEVLAVKAVHTIII